MNARPPGPLFEPPVIAGYRLVERQRIPLDRLAIWCLASVPFWVPVFVVLAALIGDAPGPSFSIGAMDLLIGLLVVLVGIPLAHEAIHGLAALLCGAKPRFGVGWGFAYTTFREPIGRRAYLFIGLAPLVLISVVCIPLMVVWPPAGGQLLVFTVGNAAGAVGDLWVAWRLRKVDAGMLLCDLADGFAVYAPEDH